jgi:diadenosine tetraphosphate (Ap4A) HIT family hydrolase
MPLTKGHVLVVTRGHWEKLGDLTVRVGQEVSKSHPIKKVRENRNPSVVQEWYQCDGISFMFQ